MNTTINKLYQQALLIIGAVRLQLSSAVGYRTILKRPGVFQLVVSHTISQFGDYLTYFALLKRVYEISGGNIADLGFLAVVKALPFMVLGPVAGILADCSSRRRIMVMSDVCNGLTILSLLWLDNLAAIYGVSCLLSCLSSFRLPAQNAFEPNLVSPKDIPILNSLKSVSTDFISISGFSLGSVVVAFAGVRVSFVIDALTYFVSAVMICSVTYPERHVVTKAQRGAWAIWCSLKKWKIGLGGYAEGLEVVRKRALLKLVLFLNMSLGFVFGIQSMLFYVFVHETLHMGDKAEIAWGGLMTNLGLGSIVGSLFLGQLIQRDPNRIKLFLKVLFVDGVLLLIFSMNTVFAVSLILSLCLGVLCAMPEIFFKTILQENVSDDLRGRVFSLFGMLEKPTTLLSVFCGTVVSKWIKAQGVLFSFALLEMAIVLIVVMSGTYRTVNREAGRGTVLGADL